MKHITIKDIAREVGMSVSTVSRALAGDKNIRSETRDKVVEVAFRLGYRPNPVARNLKSGRSNTIGVIVPEMVTPFASEIVAGIQEIMYPAGIKVMIANSNEDYHHEASNFEMMERFMVDGIVVSLCDWQRNHDVVTRMIERGMPMVFFDRLAHGFDVSQVVVDDYRMAYFMVERLIRQGRQKIVYVNGPQRIWNSHERLRGYREAMSRFGLDGMRVIDTGMDYADGVAAADRILDVYPDTDAVFSFTDLVAIGVMNRLRERGCRIPDDVAVAGFSGSRLSSMSYPAMTSVEQPLRLMGRTAAEMLLARIENPDAPCHTEVLRAELCMRASTGN